jgi:hypothetical protein
MPARTKYTMTMELTSLAWVDLGHKVTLNIYELSYMEKRTELSRFSKLQTVKPPYAYAGRFHEQFPFQLEWRTLVFIHQEGTVQLRGLVSYHPSIKSIPTG